MLAPVPQNEAQRLATLYALDLLDRESHPNLERLCRVARKFYQVEMASVTLIDSEVQRFLATDGFSPDPIQRNASFCAHAILSKEIMIIQDTLDDVRFFDNDYVIGPPGVRFYAGKPISAPNGVIVGTLNIVDTSPRQFDKQDADVLLDLAALAESEVKTFALDVFDSLTGLVNRRGLQLIAEQTISRAVRQGEYVSLIYVDVETTNNSSRQMPRLEDDYLCKMAAALRECLRGSDVLARFRSDEFAILLPDTTVEQTAVVKERIRSAVNDFFISYKDVESVDITIGSSTLEPSESDLSLDQLIEEANS